MPAVPLRRNFQNILGLADDAAAKWGLPPGKHLELFSEQPGSTLGAAAASSLSYQIQTFINYTIIAVRLVKLDTANNRFSPLQGCNFTVTSKDYKFPNPLGIDSALLAGTPEQPFVPFGPIIQYDKNTDDSPTFGLLRTVAAAGPEDVQLFFAAFRN